MARKRTAGKAAANEPERTRGPRATDALSGELEHMLTLPRERAPRATDSFMAEFDPSMRAIVRDQVRQAGTRKPREPAQGLQKWIDTQVQRRDETARELWGRAPEWITDAIGFDRFQKRVSDARKRVKAGRE